MRSDIRFELQNGIFFLQDQISYKRRHIASVERLDSKRPRLFRPFVRC